MGQAGHQDLLRSTAGHVRPVFHVHGRVVAGHAGAFRRCRAGAGPAARRHAGPDGGHARGQQREVSDAFDLDQRLSRRSAAQAGHDGAGRPVRRWFSGHDGHIGADRWRAVRQALSGRRQDHRRDGAAWRFSGGDVGHAGAVFAAVADVLARTGTGSLARHFAGQKPVFQLHGVLQKQGRTDRFRAGLGRPVRTGCGGGVHHRGGARQRQRGDCSDVSSGAGHRCDVFYLDLFHLQGQLCR